MNQNRLLKMVALTGLMGVTAFSFLPTIHKSYTDFSRRDDWRAAVYQVQSNVVSTSVLVLHGHEAASGRLVSGRFVVVDSAEDALWIERNGALWKVVPQTKTAKRAGPIASSFSIVPDQYWVESAGVALKPPVEWRQDKSSMVLITNTLDATANGAPEPWTHPPSLDWTLSDIRVYGSATASGNFRVRKPLDGLPRIWMQGHRVLFRAATLWDLRTANGNLQNICLQISLPQDVPSPTQVLAVGGANEPA